MSGISQISLNQRIQGSTPFIELQSVEPSQLQINNSKLALSEDVNVVGNLVVQGTINSASVSNSAIEVPSLVGTTSLTTPKIIFPDNQAAGLTIESSDNTDYIVLKSSEGSEQIQLKKSTFTNGNSVILGTNGSKGILQYANVRNSTIDDTNSCSLNTSGNSATATLLQNARTIGGVSFNGGASINLNGVNQAGNQNTSGTAASWTSSRNTVFNSTSSGSTTALGTLALSGTGNTTLNLDIPAVDRSDDTSATIIIANTVSANDESDFKHQLLFKNQHLSQGNSNSQNLTGGIFIEPLSQKYTIYNIGHSSQEQTTKFLYDGTYSHPTMNDFLKFQTDHATEGRHLELRASPVSANDTTTAERILPTGIKFFNDGEFSDNVNNGFMGGIHSFHAASGHAQTRIFNRTNSSGSSVQHGLLLFRDNLGLENIPTLTFQGTNGTIASGGDITLTPASGKQVVLGTKVRVGSVAETADEEDNPYLFGIEDPTAINGTGTTDVSQLLSFKYHISNGSQNRHFGFEGDQTSGGIQLVRNIFGNTANDGYTGTRTRNKLIQFNGAGFASLNEAPLTDGLHITQPSSGTCLAFSHPNDTAKRWTWLMDTNFGLTFGGNTGCQNLTLNGKARASLQAQGGIAGVYGSSDVEITATSGDVKITSGDDIIMTPTGNVGINQSAPDADLHVGTDNANANVKIKIAKVNSATRGINIGGFTDATNVSEARIQCSENLHIDPPDGGHTLFNHYEQGNIYALGNLHVSSDERIKTNIELVEDDEALEIVRQLETKKYTYIAKKTEKKRIGWIAQDVMKILPDAVSLISYTIPNVFDTYNCSFNKVDGNLYKINIPDWEGEEGSTYRLIVNKFSDDNTFSLNGKYQNGYFEIEITNEAFNIDITTIFIYGKEIDDFHTIDKTQILAIHHSSLQQLDRNDKKLEEKIVLQDEKILSLEQKLEALTKVIEDLSKTVKINENALKNMI